MGRTRCAAARSKRGALQAPALQVPVVVGMPMHASHPLLCHHGRSILCPPPPQTVADGSGVEVQPTPQTLRIIQDK